ncbi:MAG: dienelactone hydrolase family protein [Planctomycetota bacterium]|nr:dienelactone hydrolase family protein [Planctomycetota bacterium]
MIRRDDLHFAGHGGDEVATYFAAPDAGETLPGVVLAHEVFGLDAHVRDVACRLAEEGFAVVAPDLYSREGVPGPSSTADDPAPAWTVEEIRAAVAGLPDRRVVGDLDAAAAWLGERPEVDAERIAALGFCMGGCFAFLLGCASTRVAATVDFYGRIVYPDLSAEKPVQPLELALNLGCPLLAFFGEGDASIPMADVERMRTVLSQFARNFDIVTYPSAGHGFFNDKKTTFDEAAAADAWRRMLEFLREVM